MRVVSEFPEDGVENTKTCRRKLKINICKGKGKGKGKGTFHPRTDHEGPG